MRNALPQELAATAFALIYWGFSQLRCRYHAERLTNRASRDVEDSWNLFTGCFGGLPQ